MNAVVLTNLSKTYLGGKTAVDGLSLSLPAGEIFGFLGPNGAGKTTTVKLLIGMLTPSQGCCQVFSLDPAQEPEHIHALSGVVTEHAQMYDHLTGMENLLFYASLCGLSTAESSQRAGALLEQLELSDACGRRLATYSTGMRQRLSLARSLLHQPKILFLDEPTSGLDPESARNVHEMIRRLAAEQGITVFLCTHQLRYAQEICTRYGLMSQGRLLAEGTLEELRKKIHSSMTVCVQAQNMPQEFLPHRTGRDTFEIPITTEKDIPRLAGRITQNGGALYHLSARLPSLEEIYFSLTKGDNHG